MTPTTTAILVFGYPGSGKSTALEVADTLNIDTIIMGDVVRSLAYDHYGTTEIPGSKVGQYATTMRDKHGKQVMAEKTLATLTNSDSHKHISPTELPELIVIEGVRGEAEIDVFADSFDRLVTVYIEVDKDIRYNRMVDRGRDDDDATLKDARKRDEREEAWGLAELAESDHDYRITNNGSLESYKTSLRTILEQYSDGS